jgi:hypothetical protein
MDLSKLAAIEAEISDAVRPLRVQLQDALARYHNSAGHIGDPMKCQSKTCMGHAVEVTRWEDTE